MTARSETAKARGATYRHLTWCWMPSRRLLRRHLMHLAGFQVEAHPIDAIEIRSCDADEARMIRVIDGMDFAILVDAGMAGGQPVFFHRLEFGVFGIAAVILALPFGHVGVVGRLPVDRPRRAVIVRR